MWNGSRALHFLHILTPRVLSSFAEGVLGAERRAGFFWVSLLSFCIPDSFINSLVFYFFFFFWFSFGELIPSSPLPLPFAFLFPFLFFQFFIINVNVKIIIIFRISTFRAFFSNLISKHVIYLYISNTFPLFLLLLFLCFISPFITYCLV